ncbi:hypothetical protein [uncultured Algibacter sp.]|uniref:hypothetical protein n=1 Tax=uncultured Algibacter sp. TaxID=298659 RepID=UPI00262900E2|nr:hypothetical protein [uncultured Algibacter sp.]
MKKLIITIISIVFLCCSSDDAKPSGETELIGKWRLIEQLVDPGDGSGTFQPINSNRTIEFFKDGTVETNGILCFMSSEVGDVETGTYTLITDTNNNIQNDGEILPNTCISRSAKVYFDLPITGNLILWYQCIEGCGQKFKKI